MADQLDVVAGNERRKALLQRLMLQHAQASGGDVKGLLMQALTNMRPGAFGGSGGGTGGGVGGGRSIGSSGPASAVPFGGLRATAKNRQSDGQSFVHPSQVAAQFIGGLGVGASGRPGAQPGQEGSPVSRFLPTGGGPVERRINPGPPAPQAAAQGGPSAAVQSDPSAAVAATPDTPAPGPLDPASIGSVVADTGVTQAQADAAAPSSAATGWIDPAQATAASNLGVTATPNMTLDQLNAQLASQGLAEQTYPTQISSAPAPTTISSSPAPAGTTPSSGSSNLIPLGNGAYFNPATGTIHYSSGVTGQ